MRFALKHGSRILKKPFKELLQKWHIRSIPFSTQMCVIAFTLLITMSRLASSDQISGNWPLKYHHSPWLHKEFVDSYKSNSDCESPKMNKCRKENSVNTENRLGTEGDRTALKNATTIDLIMPSNGSSSKASNTMTSNEVSTESVLASTGSDRTIATSPAPKFTDSVVFFNNQCLFLDGKSAKLICDSTQGVPRLRLLEQYHLKYCDRYPLVSVLSSQAWQMLLHSVNSHKCEQILSELVMIDNLVNELICSYNQLLERYDCESGFSVKWFCKDCKKVYRDWVCSMLVPFHINGVPIRPCRSFCERVEQRCPHLHPYGKGQYAGEPVFLCIDPNIPYNPSITPVIPYADQWLCYDSCNLLDSDDSSVRQDESELNEQTQCISNSELLYRNQAMTRNYATETLSSDAAPVPLESQQSDSKSRLEFSRTTSIITPTRVTLPKTVSVTQMSKESAAYLRPTVNVLNSDQDRSDPNNDDLFSSTTQSVTQTQHTNDNFLSSSAGYSSKKSIIRLPIIVLFILLQYCLYYNDLRVLFIQLSDQRWHRRTSFIYNLLYYRIKS